MDWIEGKGNESKIMRPLITHSNTYSNILYLLFTFNPDRNKKL